MFATASPSEPNMDSMAAGLRHRGDICLPSSEDDSDEDLEEITTREQEGTSTTTQQAQQAAKMANDTKNVRHQSQGAAAAHREAPPHASGLYFEQNISSPISSVHTAMAQLGNEVRRFPPTSTLQALHAGDSEPSDGHYSPQTPQSPATIKAEQAHYNASPNAPARQQALAGERDSARRPSIVAGYT